MTKVIRVLRVLEYEYGDDNRRTAAERMADDLAHWGVPATGVTRHGATTIRSAVFLPQVTESPPDDQGDPLAYDPEDDRSPGSKGTQGGG